MSELRFMPPEVPPVMYGEDGHEHLWTPWDLDDYTWKCETCEVLHKHVIATVVMTGDGGL